MPKRHMARGDHRAAVASLKTSLEYARLVGDPFAEGNVLGNLAQNHLAGDDFHAAHESASMAAEKFRPLGPGSYLGWALATVALAAAHDGHFQEARDALSESVDVATEVSSAETTVATLIGGMAVSLAAADATTMGRLWGAARRTLASKGERLEPTDQRLVNMGLDRARKQIGAAKLEAAIHRGSEVESGEALQELRNWLVRLDPIPQRGGTGLQHGELTLREVEILALVAIGYSDGEIAEKMVVSSKTVSVHVSNAKAKLGASNRLDLALRAREMGLSRPVGT